MERIVAPPREKSSELQGQQWLEQLWHKVNSLLIGVTDVSTVTAAETLSESGQVYLANTSGGAFALALPTASETFAGKYWAIGKISSDTNNLTITGTVNGVTNHTLKIQYDFVGIYCDGLAFYFLFDERAPVSAKYQTAAGQSIPNSGTPTIVDFGTSVEDTHSCVTTGASWKFTAPRAGVYEVNVHLVWAGVAWTATNYRGFQIRKNGTAVSQAYEDCQASFTGFLTSQKATTVRLAATDYIDVAAFNNRGAGNTALQSSAAIMTQISIVEARR